MSAYYDEIHRAAEAVRCMDSRRPEAAVILGSGLDALVDRITEKAIIPYSDIPGFPTSRVAGHADRLVMGRLGGRMIAAMQGRFHFYEGHTMRQLALPVYALHALGADTLAMTNACGGINETYAPGDLMLITDHINLTGFNPLIGENDERLGPRFPDMTAVYTPALRCTARAAAERLGIPLREGVYALFSGPCYETAAEIRALRTLGADAVGISTVPEATAACHAGMQVLGVSCITNMATGLANRRHDHGEVLAVAHQGGQRLADLMEAVLTTGA